VYIDGRFQGSAGIPPNSSTAPVTYVWDTKAPITDPQGELPEKDRWLRDGEHEIKVVVHDADSLPVDSKQFTVYVQNKVQTINPPRPVRLAYRFKLGDISTYHVTIRGELQDVTGRDILGGVSAFTSEFDIGQWVEDVRPDGTALVRYRLKELPKVTFFGRPYAEQLQPGQEATAIPPSIYRIVDRFGRIIKDSVFRRTGNETLLDVLLPLPARSVRIGDTWQAEERFKIEGLGNPLRFSTNLRLDSLEWERGVECAKIGATLTAANVKLNLVPGQIETDEASSITGTGDIFLGLRSGKIIRSRSVVEMNASVDPTAIASLTTSSGSVSTPSAGPILGQSEDQGGPDEARGRARAKVTKPSNPYNPYGPGSYNPYGGSVGVDQTASRTRVKLRITTSVELKR